MAEFHFTDSRITESSSAAQSSVDPGALLTNNDEATDPNVFRVDKATGNTIATWSLAGAALTDPEAQSVDVLGRAWYADCGDNDDNRPYFRLYMLPEPTGTGELGDLAATRFLMKFPVGDGPFNIETLLTHNEAFGRYFITKQATSRLYMCPPLISAPDHYNRLIKMTPTFGPYVSDGDVTPDGKWLLTLRKDVLNKAYAYDIENGWGFEQEINLANHGQTKIEGISVDPDQMNFWVTSEGEGGVGFSTPMPLALQPSGTPPPPTHSTCP